MSDVSDEDSKRTRIDKIEALLKWATENNIQNDPEIISKLHNEARRRWGHLITRHISEIVEETLRKMG